MMAEAAKPPAPRPYTPPETPARIAHEDDDLVIAVKPSGLLSVPGRGPDRQDCMKHRLEARFGPLETVHRLDMDTSGLIVFTRSSSAARILSASFERREVEKFYEALVEGDPGEPSGEISLPIGRDWDERPRRKIDSQHGRPALTRWWRTGSNGSYAQLQLQPVTGRTHQLRIHLAAIGYPILGDRLYGNENSAERLCLHASRLAFTHPVTGLPISLESAADFGTVTTVRK